MDTTRMTSKGKLVIPKRVREAVHARPGTEFSVRVEGSRIVLEILCRKDRRVADWPGLNPAKARLSNTELCRAVVLGDAGCSR